MEKALIERARAPARQGLGSGPGELELLARLQHHGAASRLLECSRNAFVALWLACRWEPEKDGVLIGFELGENAVHQVRGVETPAFSYNIRAGVEGTISQAASGRGGNAAPLSRVSLPMTGPLDRISTCGRRSSAGPTRIPNR